MFRASHLIVASRTVPTLAVLVSITGPSRNPDSSTQVVPVISPFPLSENQPAKVGSLDPLPRGRMAVTPVRTGPTPTSSFPSPETSVAWPTSMPFTSVMAFKGPGVPSNGTPRSRARGAFSAAVSGGDRRTIQPRNGSTGRIGDLLDEAVHGRKRHTEPAHATPPGAAVPCLAVVRLSSGGSRGGCCSLVGSGSPVHDIRAQDVLASLQHLRPLVYQLVVEHQCHARPRHHVQRIAPPLEQRRAALKALVEIDHECEMAALAVGSLVVT